MAEANKTEKATPKKKKDERKKGNAFQSKDIVSVGVLLIAFIILNKTGMFIIKQIEAFYISMMGAITDVYSLTNAGVMQIMIEATKVFFITSVLILSVLFVTVIIMTGVQTKFLVSGDLLKFKYNRISFFQGIKRMFSLKSLVQLVKSLIKVIVIMAIIYSSVKGLMIISPDLLNTDMGEALVFMKDQIMAMVYKICIIFAGVAILDFGYQKYDYEVKLRMTKQEVKDEYKQTEGDPFIKGKIREKQRRMSMNRMIQQIPFADVIVRNPTHYAVALKYDLKKDLAPVVVAKGQDYLALRIVKIGEENNILIMENKPLARGLYEAVEINQYIPGEFYQAVAELMAWVYSNKEKGKA